jgi:hypothetical protein
MVHAYKLAEVTRHFLKHAINCLVKVVDSAGDIYEHRECIKAEISRSKNLND